MRLWFTPEADGVVGYRSHAGYRVVAGAPVCAPSRLAGVAGSFAVDARRTGERVCYFGAQQRLVDALEGTEPHARLLIGAQSFWSPISWLERCAGKASLRAQTARARHAGVTVELRSDGDGATTEELSACLSQWMSHRRMPVLGFLLEPNILDSLTDRVVVVAHRRGEVCGFLVASPIALRHGWLVEQVIRAPTAPNGTAELLLECGMRALAARGATFVTLGLAPLSRRADDPASARPPWFAPLMGALRSSGTVLFNFKGLEAFKEKFCPDGWEPVYAVVPGRRVSVWALYAIAGAFCGGSPVRFLGAVARHRARRG